MKNRMALFVLTAALLAPQAALWADEAGAGSQAPTTSSPSDTGTPKKHKGHKHHKKARKSDASTSSTSGAPATAPAN